MVSVAKKSVDKISIGGRKYALRRLRRPTGVAEAEVIGIGDAAGRRRQRPRAAGPAGPRRRGRRPRAARRRPRAARRRPRRAAARRSSRCRRASPSSRRTSWSGLAAPHGPGDLRLLLRRPRGRLLDERRAAPADRGADRRGRRRRRRHRLPGPLPAARPVRRPHRLAAVHLGRAVRRRGRPRRRDAGREPQLLRQRAHRRPLLGLRPRGAARRSSAASSASPRTPRTPTSPACAWAGTAR